LVEATVVMQRAEWQLESARGRRGTFSAQRSLSGAAAWAMTCPHCGRPPAALVVCRHDHCGCDACSHRCSVCAEDFCAEHGLAECHVDGQPACDEHARVCPSCRLQYCTAHEGVCAEDGHAACTTCLAPCGSCGRLVCAGHSAECVEDGLRHCVTHLEPLVDATGSYACAAHRKACHVDGQVFSPKAVEACPVCGKDACARHRAACGHCGRNVCTA